MRDMLFTLNGKDGVCSKDRNPLEYWQIAMLAGMSPNSSPSITYTTRNGGVLELSRGQNLELSEGMAITCVVEEGS